MYGVKELCTVYRVFFVPVSEAWFIGSGSKHPNTRAGQDLGESKRLVFLECCMQIISVDSSNVSQQDLVVDLAISIFRVVNSQNLCS